MSGDSKFCFRATDFLTRLLIFRNAYSAFITDFLHDTQLPRISAREPVPDQRLSQRVATSDPLAQRSLEAVSGLSMAIR
jgi:hypothetical protein